MNMDIWVTATLNQPFHFQKNKVESGKTLFFVVGPFCTPHSIYFNIDFWQGSFV